MMMKKKYSFWLLIMLSALFLSACADTDDMDKKQEGKAETTFLLNMNFPNVDNDGEIDPELIVRTLRIFVFNPDGNLATDVVVVDDVETIREEDTNKLTYIVKMIFQSGKKTVCIVANEPDDLTTKDELDNIQTLTELTALNLRADHNTYNDPSKPLLPFTIKQEVNLNVGENKVLFELLRVVGKLDVRIRKEEGNNRTVKILSSQVINTPKTTRLMEGNPLTGILLDIDKVDYTTDNDIVYDYSRKMKPVYLYEHPWGKGDESNAILSATSLKLELLVREHEGVQEKRTYTLPLISDFEKIIIDQQEKRIPVFGVARNKVADMFLTVETRGITINYYINDWWDEEEWLRDPSNGNSNMNPEDWWDDPGYTFEQKLPKPDLQVTYKIEDWGDVTYKYIQVRKGDIFIHANSIVNWSEVDYNHTLH